MNNLLTIVVPVYNEEEIIKTTSSRLCEVVDELKEPFD